MNKVVWIAVVLGAAGLPALLLDLPFHTVRQHTNHYDGSILTMDRINSSVRSESLSLRSGWLIDI